MPRSNRWFRWLGFVVGADPAASDPHAPAAVVRFTLIAVLTYSALISSTFLQQRHGAFYRAFGNLSFASFGGTGSVSFFDAASPTLRNDVRDRIRQWQANPSLEMPGALQLPRQEGEKDTLVMLGNSRTPTSLGFLRTSHRLMAYTPTVLMLALVVATPGSVRRRIGILLVSAVALQVAIFVKLAVFVSHGGFANAGKKYHLFDPSPFWLDLLRRANEILCIDPTFNYIFPIGLWVLAAAIVGMAASVIRASAP